MKRLPIDQVRALVTWERIQGRCWKSKLRQAWATGRYGFSNPDLVGPLQALRNQSAAFINKQIDMGSLRAQLHHHDLSAAARTLIDQLSKDGEHYYSTPRLNVEELLLQSPEHYDGKLVGRA